MIEKPLAEGWKLQLYAEHAIAMWPPYAENRDASLNVECSDDGEVEVWFNRERQSVFIPRAVLEALFAAVDEWTAAQETASPAPSTGKGEPATQPSTPRKAGDES